MVGKTLLAGIRQSAKRFSSKGNYIIRDEIEIIQKRGEGFVTDYWPKPDDSTQTVYPKISFVKYFPPLDWYFGTGEYLDNIEKEIQMEALDRISKIRFGDGGYLFAGRWDGVSLLGPATGRNMLDIADINGVKIVRELIAASQKNGGFVEYVMPKFEGMRPAPKISYASGIEKWQWYVGAGLYIDEIDALIEKNRMALEKKVQGEVLKIVLFLFALIALIILMARYISAQAERSLTVFSAFFDKAAREAATIDPTDLPFTEFSTLAVSANRMIDERRLMETELRESRERWRAIINNAMLGVYQVTREGQILLVNPKMAEMFGYASPAEMIDSAVNIENLYLEPEERKDNLRVLEETGFLDRSEIRFRRKDGKALWIQASSRFIKNHEGKYIIEGFITDIHERVEAENAMRESEERYRVLVELSPEAIFVHRNGKIVYINPAGVDLLGASHTRQLVGEPVLDFIHPDHHDLVKSRMAEIQATKKQLSPVEERYVRIDGTVIYVEAVGTYIFYDGEPASLAVIRDITAGKQAEAEKRKLETMLQQAQRMDSIGTLAGGIAHDFNNLLMGIQGRISLVMSENDVHHKHMEHLREVENYVKSATDLTRQLLGVARGGKYEVKPVDVNELVYQSSEMFGRTRKEISISQKMQEDIWAIAVDRSQIEQVLLNLYVNAWQAMTGSGELIIKTENVTLDENFVKPFLVKEGKYVKIAVTDTGIGMDEEVRKRIFDPFFTTKRQGRGTGLGLASAYGIIKSHDGIITVSSRKGAGATFTIYLPASDKLIEKEEHVSDEPVLGTGTILIIDDESLILEVGNKMLGRLGYNVLVADQGDKGIAIYKEKRDQIDMIVLDMIMPKTSGAEVYDQLKATNPAVKVLLSSGYSIDGEAKKILERGCNGFIQKPFNLNEISRKIAKILAGAVDPE